MKQEGTCQKPLKIGHRLSTNKYTGEKMIQDTCEILGNTGCAAFAFLYAIGQEPELLVKDFDNLVEKKILGSDATVLDYSRLAKFYGENVSVTWKSPDEYIPGQMYLGRWTRPGFNHFVVMKDDKVIFNPLKYSKCVECGTLTDIRVITIL